MASAKATYGTTGVYQPEDPVLRWLEKEFPIESLKHAEFTALEIVKSVFAPRGDLTAEDDNRAFYVGLGDQFDDDRRVVREIPSAAVGSSISTTELVASAGKNSTTEDES